MFSEITIWSLNRAADLIEGKQDEIKSLFKDLQVNFGNRDHFSIEPQDVKHQLMYEDSFNEYFVPIPIKCIGSLFLNSDDLDKEGKEFLNGIIDAHSYFQDTMKFYSYWEAQRADCRMMTTDYMGYYDILTKHKNNVLIGYSQGGLVARYLAFLDEYVFKKNVITAVITVQSPNYGSPLANANNRQDVTDGLIKFILSFPSFYEQFYKSLNDYITGEVNFEHLLSLIKNLKSDLEASTGSKKKLYDTLLTAEKWLSGLNDNPELAFYDLNILHLAKEFSVLNLVNSHLPQKIYSGSIIGMNNNLNKFIKSLFGCLVQIVWELFIKKINILGSKIEENISKAQSIYNTCVMNENLSQDIDKRISDIFEAYKSGDPKLKIPLRAHDFIIPSIYQRLPESENFLGNYVNKYANHDSGKSRKEKAGSKNFKLIMRLLSQYNKKIQEV